MNSKGYKFYFEVVAIIVAVFGVPSYFYSQYIDRQNSRIERSFGFYNDLRSDSSFATRLALLKELSDPKTQIFLKGGPSRKALEKYFRQVKSSQPDFLENILAVTQLFDSAQTCVSVGLCDSHTMQTLLGEEAVVFQNLFGSFIASVARRNSLLETGCGLALMSGAEKPDYCASYK